MIDDPVKTAALIATMKDHLPIEVSLTSELRRTLSAKAPEAVIPERCNVVDVLNLGDEGGICCALHMGGPDARAAHFVSLTHLRLDRRSPLFRAVDAYQRHRIKKLRKQGSRGL